MEQRLKPPVHRKNLPGLSRRESEVLIWVAKGKTNSDIGEILGISRRTVDTLLSRTYQKLGVETRTAAVMCMIEFITAMQNLN
jgi:DNA-binding CsgD family transcriptional regulator